MLGKLYDDYLLVTDICGSGGVGGGVISGVKGTEASTHIMGRPTAGSGGGGGVGLNGASLTDSVMVGR